MLALLPLGLVSPGKSWICYYIIDVSNVFILCQQWLIYMDEFGMRTNPSGPIFFFFMQCSGNFGTIGTHPTPWEIIFTARKRSLGQGNIFSSVCQEFCSEGGLPQCILGYPPRSRHPLQEQAPPLPSRRPLHSACWETRLTSGRYASFWNAILLCSFLDNLAE